MTEARVVKIGIEKSRKIGRVRGVAFKKEKV